MRVGNADISNGVVDHQIEPPQAMGCAGSFPDGALYSYLDDRAAERASFKLQDQFIRDLLAAVPAKELKLLYRRILVV